MNIWNLIWIILIQRVHDILSQFLIRVKPYVNGYKMNKFHMLLNKN